MPLLYEDLVKGNTANPPKYDQQGMLVPGSGGAPAAPTATATLPPLNPAGAPPAQPTQDPYTIFNTKLMEMLTQAQGQSNAPLYNQANKLDTTQTENSMKPAGDLGIAGLAPGDALGARKAAAGVYDPEIKNLNDRIALNNESISKFESAVKAAKDFGDDYAKYVKPDDATVQAVKQQMAAGFLPSATVLDKVGKFLTADDWNALSAAKKTTDDQPNSYKEYALTTSTPTPAGYSAWLDRQSQYKTGSGSGSGGGTMTERLLGKQSDIINKVKALPKGTDGKINPDDYLNLASDYIQSNGTVADFLAAAPPTRYLTPANASYVKSTLSPSSGRSL